MKINFEQTTPKKKKLNDSNAIDGESKGKNENEKKTNPNALFSCNVYRR